MSSSTALLGDSPGRDYTRKLRLFNAFAAPQLQQALGELPLRDGMRILDAGCGSGEMLGWLRQAAGARAQLTGIDLSEAHVAAARAALPQAIEVLRGDLLSTPVPQAPFDMIWCANTLNHLRDPPQGVRRLARLLAPGGLIAIGQSALVPEMCFAWDARLERLTQEAARLYYQDRYGLAEADLRGVRNLLGWVRGAGLRRLSVRTLVLERVAPLSGADRAFLLENLLQGMWGERLRPYLAPADYAQLRRLADPLDPAFALDRPDFHFIQTFTIVTGSA
jgi:SAM-dependent methyltransferase